MNSFFENSKEQTIPSFNHYNLMHMNINMGYGNHLTRTGIMNLHLISIEIDYITFI